MAKKIPLEKLNLLAMFDIVNDLSISARKNVVSEYNLFNFTTETQKKISSISVEPSENIIFLILQIKRKIKFFYMFARQMQFKSIGLV